MQKSYGKACDYKIIGMPTTPDGLSPPLKLEQDIIHVNLKF